MGFWEDSSPIVKVALIVGVLGIIYLAIAYFVGLFPFPASCTHCPEGSTCAPQGDDEEQSGCPQDSDCIDGECVQQERGINR
jgi:hypothetical protein